VNFQKKRERERERETRRERDERERERESMVSEKMQSRLHQFFSPPEVGTKRKAEEMPSTTGGSDPAGDSGVGNTGEPAASKRAAAGCGGKEEVDLGSKEMTREEISKTIALMLAKTRKIRESVFESRQKGEQPKLKQLLSCDAWRGALGNQFEKKYVENLEAFVQSEWKAKVQVFPEPWNIFRALNACPPGKVKVVILGQDPYHNVGQAMGLSFSVPNGIQIPSSLRNIYKELASDCGFAIPKHGNLERWTAQGVLLLNAVLTVKAHQAGSHQKKGWEAFTEEIMKIISSQVENVVFMLWGNWAQKRGMLIRNSSKHCILKCAHPSGLSAHRGFFGCKHFSKANNYLREKGKTPIDWQL